MCCQWRRHGYWERAARLLGPHVSRWRVAQPQLSLTHLDWSQRSVSPLARPIHHVTQCLSMDLGASSGAVVVKMVFVVS